MAVKIQLRRDTAAAWTSANPTLAQGELGLETDTTYYKIGDGTTAWNSLAYGSIVGTLVDDSVTTSKILDANVTEAKLASDAVTTAKILDANVTAAKLASSSVETTKLANKSVTSAKLAALSVAGQVTAYTFVLADAETLVVYNGDSAANFTVPPNSSVPCWNTNKCFAVWIRWWDNHICWCSWRNTLFRRIKIQNQRSVCNCNLD